MAIRVPNAHDVRRRLLRRLPRTTQRMPRVVIALAIAVAATSLVLVGIRISAPVGPYIAAGPAFASGALERRPVELVAPEFLLYPQRLPAEEGWLSVPGDHAHPGSPSLRVHYTLLARQLPAESSEHQAALVADANSAGATASDPAPILFLADSSSGSASAALAGTGFAALQALRAHAAVIAFDARDSVHAQPVAHCPGSWWSADAEPTSLAALQAQFEPRVRSCAESFTEVSGEARFDPAQSVADIEALRGALGIERLRLLATGDATPLALRYLAAHPHRVERALLLGARLPSRPAPRPQQVESALARALRALRDDPYWSRRLPEPAESLRVAIARLEVQPVAQAVYDPHRGTEATLLLGGADLRLAVLDQLSRADGLDALGRLLEDVFAQRYALLADTALAWRRAEAPRAALLARQCTAPASAARARRERMTAAFTLLGDAADLLRQARCNGWPEALRAPAWSAPAEPPPVLFVAGEFDPLAPLEQAHALAEQLPGAQVLQVAAGAPEAQWFLAMQAEARASAPGADILAFLGGAGDARAPAVADAVAAALAASAPAAAAPTALPAAADTAVTMAGGLAGMLPAAARPE